MLTITYFMLLALILLAGTSGGLAATDEFLMEVKVNHTYTLHDDVARLAPWQVETSEFCDCDYRRALFEMAGVMVTAFVSVTMGNAWKKRSLPRSKFPRAALSAHDGAMVSQDARSLPKESSAQQEPSQAELDWVSAARAGALKLTDDVFSAAMQWLLEHPLSNTLDSMGSKDKQLMRPVSELLQRGRQQEAISLLEQIGRLDKLERDLQRGRAKTASTSGTSSPLRRSSPDLSTSARRLRKSVESYRVSGAHKVHRATQPQSVHRGLFSADAFEDDTGDPFLRKCGCACGA